MARQTERTEVKPSLELIVSSSTRQSRPANFSVPDGLTRTFVGWEVTIKGAYACRASLRTKPSPRFEFQMKLKPPERLPFALAGIKRKFPFVWTSSPDIIGSAAVALSRLTWQM